MKYEVEPVTETDLKGILALQKVCFQSEAELYNDYAITPLTQDLASIKSEFRESTFLKVAEGAKIIASVRSQLKDATCHISRLVVHPEFQNQGLGRLLMSAMESNSLSQHPETKTFELFTGNKSEKNIALYKKLGYQVFKTKTLGTIEFVFMGKTF
ncbi:MAG: GNAT family N-acetyltransferase [SAR324 cluster bacterium]|nr:GNAT family N-acetyltransferase [SAR324 cluster bacterium]